MKSVQGVHRFSLSPLPRARLTQPYSNMLRSSGSSTPGMKGQLPAQPGVTILLAHVMDPCRVVYNVLAESSPNSKKTLAALPRAAKATTHSQTWRAATKVLQKSKAGPFSP